MHYVYVISKFFRYFHAFKLFKQIRHVITSSSSILCFSIILQFRQSVFRHCKNIINSKVSQAHIKHHIDHSSLCTRLRLQLPVVFVFDLVVLEFSFINHIYITMKHLTSQLKPHVIIVTYPFHGKQISFLLNRQPMAETSSEKQTPGTEPFTISLYFK